MIIIARDREIKYIKIPTNLFDIPKVKEMVFCGSDIFIAWLFLYLESRKIHDKGYVYIIPYLSDTPINDWASVILNVQPDECKDILNILTRLGLIIIDKKGIKVKDIIRTAQQIRDSSDYKEWRNKVFIRDKWTCQMCGEHGGKLNAHHIKAFAKYPSLRFDISNGITLCEACHKAVHKNGVINWQNKVG